MNKSADFLRFALGRRAILQTSIGNTIPMTENLKEGTLHEKEKNNLSPNDYACGSVCIRRLQQFQR